MKKILFLLLTGFICSATIGCVSGNTTINSKSLDDSNSISQSITIDDSKNENKYYEYSDYYLPKAHELRILCWQIEPNVWKCGLTDARQLVYPFELIHVQYCIPCDLDIMKEILKTYSEDVIKERTSIVEINYPNPSGFYKGAITYDNIPFLRESLGLSIETNASSTKDSSMVVYNKNNDESLPYEKPIDIPFEYIPGNIITMLDYVLCWQIEPNVWRCGLMGYFHGNTGYNFLEFRHIQECISCTLSEMKEILLLYPNDKRDEYFKPEEFAYPFVKLPDSYLGRENIEYLSKELGLS